MRKYSKIISSVIVIFMVSLFATGCSSGHLAKDELGFIKLMNEMNKIETYQSNGEISLDIKEMPEDIIDDEALLVLDALKNYSIKYEIKQDITTMNYELSLFLNNKNNNQKILFMSMVSNGEIHYIKIDDMKKVISKFADVPRQEIDAAFAYAFGDAQYISFTNEQLIDFYLENLELSAVMSETELESFREGMEELLDPEKLLDKQEKIQKSYYPYLIKAANIYKNFDSGLDLISHDNNKYTLSISALDLLKLVESFLNYTIDHVTEVGEFYKTFIPFYFESANELYGGNMEIITQAQNELANLDVYIDQVVTEVNANKDQYKAMVTTTMAELRSELEKYAKDTKLTVELEKVNSSTYESSVTLNLDITDGGERMAFDFVTHNTTKVLKSFKATLPTKNVMDMEAFMERVNAQQYNKRDWNN